MENNNSYSDERGKLLFLIKNDNFISVESTVSINKKNVFRGLHINKFSKMVSCIQGSILDIIINMKTDDKDYLKPQYFNLSASTENNKIIVPPNYAHGFLTLEENTIIIYHFTDKFIPEETIHIHYQDPYINLQLPKLSQNIIISKKDNLKNFIKPIDYVIIGSTGYLGKHITNILKNQGKNVISISERLNDIFEIKNKLTLYKPKYVINSAGLTGEPNIDWCDNNKEETIETNITYQLTLCDICSKLSIHLTIFGSGGIFNTSGIKKECDNGDYYNKFYSECRIYLENIVKNYKNVLYLRINYPISSCSNPKNLLIKLKNFTNVSNNKISITCVDTLFPLLSAIIENNEIGIMNFVNPEIISLVDIKKKYNNINNINNNYKVINLDYRYPIILDTSKIKKYNPENIFDSLKKILYNCK